MKALITKDNIHIWNPNNPWHKDMLLAQLPDGTLAQFSKGKDQAVNELYLLGYKDAAREVNKYFNDTEART